MAATPDRIDGYLPIEQYAAVGDCHALALVGADGSIDWLCLPQLDAPSVFGALLDPVGGGSFSLAPAVPFTVSRSYLPHTNVLCTEFHTDAGAVRVTDAMTVDPSQATEWRELVRSVEPLSGAVPMRWRLHPRFDYGRHGSQPERRGDGLLWRSGGLQLLFRCWSAGDPNLSGDALEGAFTASEGGDHTILALVAGDGPALPVPTREEIERRLSATAWMWRRWISNMSYDGPWKEAVERSLLALRLLALRSSGAITAAGTTSLPEALGAKRNYDYRYSWVRDLSFTADALMRVGMREFAHDSVSWLLGAVARTSPRVDPVYTLDAEVLRSQEKLPLPGYRATQPVHLGNQAGSQLQLGGFGDLLETVWLYCDSGGVLAPAAGERLADSADLLCEIWSCQDAGLWELGDDEHYTTSKLGCWTALTRIADLAARGQVPSRNPARWAAERDRVRDFIDTRLWSDSRHSYVMKAGSEMLDCGVLLAARRGFGDPRGERMRSTISSIREELGAGGPLLYRYSGMQDSENAFLACSFWMAEALALSGDRDAAAELMDEMIGLSGDLGLLSEEMEPGSHALRGNFPQALTHLALISAAAIVAER